MGTQRERLWAVVLAGGDGKRLSALTTDERGRSVPKQFCSLKGGPALIQTAMQRAERIVPRERICVVVSRAHAHHWQESLWPIPRWNIFVEPRNRGTAHGVLHAALAISNRDRHAKLLFLPADHYVEDEEILAASIRSATAFVDAHPNRLCLLGIQPESEDLELGYIVPSDRTEGAARHVARFVEKPPAALARELIAAGAMWNSFIFATSMAALLQMLSCSLSEAVEEMQLILSRDASPGSGAASLNELYDRLTVVDLSTTVVQGAEPSLRVIPTERCGWTDLGTPRRVAEILRRLGTRADSLATGMMSASRCHSVDLASNFYRLVGNP